MIPSLATPQRLRLPLPDGDMALLHWHRDEAPRLLFAHANGFCASAYKPMMAKLSERFDILAMDLRGHGRTQLPIDPASHRRWDIYGRDIAAIIAQLDRQPDLMAGHSMGGTSSLLAASLIENAPPVALIEPVIMPPFMYALFQTPIRPWINRAVGMGTRARARSNGWPDRDTVIASYKTKTLFSDWVDGAVEAYLEDGLIETDDGVKLACDPAWEAANFEAQGHAPFRALRSLTRPLSVLKAERDTTVVGAPHLRAHGVRVDTLKGAGHLAPMSHPSEVCDWLSAQL